MNKLVVGETRRCDFFRSGESQRGPWELISVKDDRGKMEITIFPTNVPTGMRDGGQFIMKNIKSVTHGFKKDKNDQWRVNITVEGDVEAIGSEMGDIPGVDVPVDVEWASVEDEKGLPW